eukprot:scaffold245331_cov48-Attheya_sp.AAC.3
MLNDLRRRITIQHNAETEALIVTSLERESYRLQEVLVWYVPYVLPYALCPPFKPEFSHD